MKNLIRLFLISIILYSCGTDLEQIPPIQISTDNITDPETVLFATYSEFQSAIDREYSFGSIRSDDGQDNGEDPWTSFHLFTPNLQANFENNSEIFLYWDGLYKTISRANLVLENLDLIDSPDQRLNIEGEARFLRALSYFKLVRAYGDVPISLSSLVDPNDSEVLTRRPVADVYEIVISDLQIAISNLNESSSNGRADGIAARAILGKVFMYLENYTDAIPLFEEVINSSDTALLANYADIFPEDNELNEEIIFAVQYENGVGRTQNFSELFLGVESVNRATSDIIDAYDPTDIRLTFNIDTQEALNRNTKYIPAGGRTGLASAGNDFIVIRLADVILFYAEALNETGSPATTVLPLLDDIRTRAGLAILNPAILNTQALVEDAIKQERRFELAFENHRWFDLVRWGDAMDEVGFTDPNYILFPIPRNEINSTGGIITQNPGY